MRIVIELFFSWYKVFYLNRFRLMMQVIKVLTNDHGYRF